MPFPHLALEPRIHPSVLVLPGALVTGDVEIGQDSSIWYHTVIRGDVHAIRIGERSNIQDLSIIHVSHDVCPARVGNDVTVGHRAVLHGCTIADRVLIGMGAIVMDGAEVGEESIVGAGALVTEGTIIPPGSLALGSPARVKRALSAEERQNILTSAQHYVELARAYQALTLSRPV